METEFTPLMSLSGGVLIGIATVMLLLLNGRIAGISGILGAILPPAVDKSRLIENIAFLVGLLAAIPLAGLVSGAAPVVAITSNSFLLGAGGFIVGLGVSLGGGCTSGHGVCGISRLSARSILATIIFMISAAATVFILRHVLGGV